METRTAEVTIVTPLLQVINPTLSKTLGKNLPELAAETNKSIERGIKSPVLARDAEAMVQNGRKAIKTVNDIRLMFTRPIDEGKKKLMKEVEDLLSPLQAANTRLNEMVLARLERLRAEEAKKQAEAEAAQREAEAKAKAEEERRRNISKAQGGTGENVKPVEVEKIEQPISTLELSNTTRTRRIIDVVAIQSAIDNGTREIEGVKIYQVWTFDIEDSRKIPDKYRKTVRA